MKIQALAISAMMSAAALSACSPPTAEKAVEAAEDMGMTNVVVTGRPFFATSCSKDEGYEFDFTALSASGRQVRGVVCASALLKGYTVRIAR